MFATQAVTRKLAVPAVQRDCDSQRRWANSHCLILASPASAHYSAHSGGEVVLLEDSAHQIRVSVVPSVGNVEAAPIRLAFDPHQRPAVRIAHEIAKDVIEVVVFERKITNSDNCSCCSAICEP
jgi:hypothetical protein